MDFINIARGIAHIGHVPYESVYFSGRYLEGAILTHLKKLNIVSPNGPERQKVFSKKTIDFVGAFVQEPQAGWKFQRSLGVPHRTRLASDLQNHQRRTGFGKNWNTFRSL